MLAKRAVSALIVAGLAALSVPAGAETNVVTSTSVNAYNVANVLNRRGDAPLSAKDAELIKRALTADTQVDDGERAMLDHLIAGEVFVIKHPKNELEVHFARIASDEAKQVLQQIQSFSYDDPILQNWMEATTESVGKVVLLYAGSSVEREKAIDVLVKRVGSVWKEDSWQNDYRTLKGEMAGWSARCNTQSGAAYRSCRTMVYEVMVKADRGLDGSTAGGIPDFIYNRFKPKED
ncbi:hypothetical protein [Pontixanthobacter sp. CEM42]|uniref:hypothetical protein n=1 Tax=Pontixanthobacter sp. CEM42 TaxID=2792077 RepID=UPI001AE0C4E2|nr:hypothetical protein [Pontixanthobacter sp. CEM42]